MKMLASAGLLSVLLCNGVEARDIEVGTDLRHRAASKASFDATAG
jgi:hypothetical protein